MKRTFTVLVVDDSTKTIQRTRKRRLGARLGSVYPEMPEVRVFAIHVELERSEGRAIFKRSFLQALSESCRTAPDLILVDYGFVHKDDYEWLERESASRGVTKEDLCGKFLTVADLAEAVIKNTIDDSIDNDALLRNFFNARCPVYVYSYTSKNYVDAIGSMSEREMCVRMAFPSATSVRAIDTKMELYNQNEFDWPAPSKKDAEYYPYQISTLLDGVVEREILLRSLFFSRYLRLRRTAFATAVVTSVASAIGLAGGWAGSLVFTLLQTQALSQAIVLAVATTLLIFIVGFIIPFGLEYLMLGIVREERSQK